MTFSVRRKIYLCTLGSALLLSATASVAFGAIKIPKVLIYNPTESAPIGFYIKTGEAIGTGKLILFKTPDAAVQYSQEFYNVEPLPFILKDVKAGYGDHVCNKSGTFYINNTRLDVAHPVDRENHPLPQWYGCRTLQSHEVFVYSSRVENSFDSRYYGPINLDTVEGVFKKL